jgi:hypothetical protein
MRRGFLSKPKAGSTPVALKTERVELKKPALVITIPNTTLDSNGRSAPDFGALFPPGFTGYNVVTLPFPGTFPGEPAALCLLYPGAKEAILALPDFPTRLTVPPFLRWPFSVEDIPGMGKAMVAIIPIPAGGLILNERPLALFPATMPCHPNIIHPHDLLHQSLQMLHPPFREAFYNLHNCKNSQPVTGVALTNGICATNSIAVGAMPGPYVGQYAAVCQCLSRMNHR